MDATLLLTGRQARGLEQRLSDRLQRLPVYVGMDARADLATDGLPDVSVTYVGDWHVHPKFVEANACHVP